MHAEITRFLQEKIEPQDDAREISRILLSNVNYLYQGKPGDDSTVACVKIIEAKETVVMKRTLIALLCLGLLAGCAADTNSTAAASAESTASAVSTPATADPNATPSIIPTVNADEKITITNPVQLNTTKVNMQRALILAAKNGVDVRILTPHIPDKWYVFEITQANYLPLIEAGVKIYQYTPGFVHTKNFVSDDCVAIVGTVNTDYRSYYLHFECGALMYDVPAVMASGTKDALAAADDIAPGLAQDGFADYLQKHLIRGCYVG